MDTFEYFERFEDFNDVTEQNLLSYLNNGVRYYFVFYFVFLKLLLICRDIE